MKRTVFTVLAVTLALAGVARAETSVGRISTISPDDRTVVLRDGQSFDFSQASESRPLAGYLPGDSVAIQWNASGDKMIGESISSTSVHHTVGRIDSIHGTDVKLSDGVTYSFANTDDMKSRLSGFRPGDSVRIATADSSYGNKTQGLSIGGNHGADQIVGRIADINAPQGKLILDNGQTFTTGHGEHATAMLEGFRKGDTVRVLWNESGDDRLAEVVQPVDAQ